MIRRTTAVALLASAITIVLLAGATSAQANTPTPQPSPTAATSDASTAAVVEPQSVSIPFTHKVTLSDAITAASTSGYNVIGYGYDNPGLVGEFFPTTDLTATKFTTIFHEQYGMDPAVSALRVVADQAKDGSLTPQRSGSAAKQMPLGSSLPVFTPAADGTGTAATQANLAEQHAVAAAAAAPSARAAAALTDWHPGFTQISLSKSGTIAIVGTQSVWVPSREDLHKVPDFWGVEFKVALNNTTIERNDPNGTRQPVLPSCTAEPNVRDQFWAKNYNYTSWTVYQVGAASLTTIGAYADLNDNFDQCSRNSMSIGIGFPRAVPYSLSGNVQLATTIYAPIGNVVSNRVQSTVEAKEGNDCSRQGASHVYNSSNFIPNTNCMGLNQTVSFPNGVADQNWTVLSSRGAAYPSSPLVRVPVFTVTNGLPESCVYLDKEFNHDSSGLPVPQRQCNGG